MMPLREVSSRKIALRAGNQQGMLIGLTQRAGGTLGELAAANHAAMASRGQWPAMRAIPRRWRRLFERAFVDGAIFASTTDHKIKAR